MAAPLPFDASDGVGGSAVRIGGARALQPAAPAAAVTTGRDVQRQRSAPACATPGDSNCTPCCRTGNSPTWPPGATAQGGQQPRCNPATAILILPDARPERRAVGTARPGAILDPPSCLRTCRSRPISPPANSSTNWASLRCAGRWPHGEQRAGIRRAPRVAPRWQLSEHDHANKVQIVGSEELNYLMARSTRAETLARIVMTRRWHWWWRQPRHPDDLRDAANESGTPLWISDRRGHDCDYSCTCTRAGASITLHGVHKAFIGVL